MQQRWGFFKRTHTQAADVAAYFLRHLAVDLRLRRRRRLVYAVRALDISPRLASAGRGNADAVPRNARPPELTYLLSHTLRERLRRGRAGPGNVLTLLLPVGSGGGGGGGAA